MPRIAIVGSCITRDLWPIRGGGAEALLYVSRTSLPSLLSGRVEGFRPSEALPADLHRNEHNALVADVRKTALSTLMAWRPTHIIFDFIDERFDLLAIGSSLVSNSGEMIRSGYRTQPVLEKVRTISRLSDTCDRIWQAAAVEFAALIQATPLAHAQLILHSARWAESKRLPDGRIAPIDRVEVTSGQPVVIADYNAVLARQEAMFEGLLPMAKIDAGAFRLADAQHRWGESPFHYVPEYYDEVRRQLADLGLADAFSGPLAEPSAPAA